MNTTHRFGLLAATLLVLLSGCATRMTPVSARIHTTHFMRRLDLI